MKKVFLTTCALLLLAAIVITPGFSAKQEEIDIWKLPVSNVEGFLATENRPETLTELENLSPYIVKAVLCDDAVNHEPVYNDSNIITGYTVSTLKISESYKGDFKAGDTIPFAESYCVMEKNNDEPYLLTYLDYKPLVSGQEYIFFICQGNNFERKGNPGEGLYCSTYSGLSSYEVPSSETRSVMDAEIEEWALENPDEEIYDRIAKQVEQKYLQ